ncbi:MAG: RNA methyltransferase [Bradymonadaceae bacterium]
MVVVLWEPQDDINIGNAVRACKNFGVHHLRLVRPAQADPDEIAVSAPKADDVIANIETYQSLEDAVADCVYVIGTTARSRAARRVVTEPRGAAASAVDLTDDGNVAYLFGREDSGLPNDALDSCQSIVTIPTDPDYSSLNLGQAVLLNIWEVFRVATDQDVERPDVEWVAAESGWEPATMEEMERIFEMAEEALLAIDFFRTPATWRIMRTLRSMFLRASLDEREAAIWMGIFSEILDTAEDLKRATDDGEDDD